MTVAEFFDALDGALAHESATSALMAAAAAAGGWFGSRAKLAHVEAAVVRVHREGRAVGAELARLTGTVERLIARLVARRTLHRNEVR